MPRIPEQIRLKNLELLISEAGSAANLANRVGTNSSYLSQVRRQMPTKKGTPRGIGDELAGKLELGMGKPPGWMDVTHSSAWGSSDMPHQESRQIAQTNLLHLHPLIDWSQAGEWLTIADDYLPTQASELLPCPVNCSKKTYILRVRGVSMEPRFRDSDLIFVDPEIAPTHGKFVVVLLGESNQAELKQLIIEGDNKYLKALNPDWPKPIVAVDSTATICGVVVFKGELV